MVSFTLIFHRKYSLIFLFFPPVIWLIQFSSASKGTVITEHDTGWELERRLLLMKDAPQHWKTQRGFHYPAGWVLMIWKRRVIQYYFPQHLNL